MNRGTEMALTDSCGNPKGLGIRIAEKAHHEGRKARKNGTMLSCNPYDKNAKVDSDEWLRYNNWRNGWLFMDGQLNDEERRKYGSVIWRL